MAELVSRQPNLADPTCTVHLLQRLCLKQLFVFRPKKWVRKLHVRCAFMRRCHSFIPPMWPRKPRKLSRVVSVIESSRAFTSAVCDYVVSPVYSYIDSRKLDESFQIREAEYDLGCIVAWQTCVRLHAPFWVSHCAPSHDRQAIQFHT
eukprot:TRINITY_DN71982_c0_g1_i1.p1 TRINITY_DN71982_c0_g1~~TRINITY_DN71982_c0_g1_i1.p1  ORF type:complete len:148 (+),score=5.81 TRINITY_DN71982_c0_g1_i1:743-1186(+)